MEKNMKILLTVGLIKMSEWAKSSEGRMKVELDLPIYTTETGLENATGVDNQVLVQKTDLVNLKFYVDKLDINNFKNLPNNLSNLKSKVDKNEVKG